MGDGPIFTTKAKMEDLGTRYRHLADLQENWNTGLEVTKNANKTYSTPTDRARIATLEGALKLLNAYMDQVSNYTGQQNTFAKTVNDCAPSKQVIDAIRQDRAAATKAKESEIEKSKSPEEKETGSTDSDPPEPAGVS